MAVVQWEELGEGNKGRRTAEAKKEEVLFGTWKTHITDRGNAFLLLSFLFLTFIFLSYRYGLYMIPIDVLVLYFILWMWEGFDCCINKYDIYLGLND